MFAPVGTPRAVVQKLNAEIGKALASPELAKRFGDMSLEAKHSTSEAFGKFLQSGIALARGAGDKYLAEERRREPHRSNARTAQIKRSHSPYPPPMKMKNHRAPASDEVGRNPAGSSSVRRVHRAKNGTRRKNAAVIHHANPYAPQNQPTTRAISTPMQ